MDTVVDLIFHTGVLRPQEAHNVALVNRHCSNTVHKHLKHTKFVSIQESVEKQGMYTDCMESFLYAISMGYCAYQYTIHSIIRNNGSLDVLKHCLFDRKIRVLSGAVVEAMRNENPAYFELICQATSREEMREAYDWIVEERLSVRQPLELLGRFV
jgi:hypothetical protein